jgi:glycosyltransferase involved in cell wall biosynthesis
MKVLSLLKTGTGAKWAVRQMRELSSEGIQSLALMPPGPTADELEVVTGVTVRRFGSLSDPANHAVLREWRQAIASAVETYRPDVIHSQFVATTIAARQALGARPIPVVFQVPGPLHLEAWWSRRLDTSSARHCDTWIATCELTRTLLRRGGITPDRIGIAYYGLDGDDWQVPRSRAQADGLGIPRDRVLVGMVSFVYPPRFMSRRGIKGHEDFMAGLKKSLDQGANIHGVIIGGPRPGAEKYAQRLQQHGRELLGDRLTWVPSVRDVRPWYAAMDVAVHPSLSENLGAAAESMMAGVPTIATEVGGFPDLITHCQTGWLVRPHSPDSISTAIRRAISDGESTRRIAKAGRAFATALLDPTVNAQRIAGYLAKAVAGTSAAS